MIAAIYARKSTDQSGVADEQKSVARQVDHARAYAAAKGWTVVDAHVYVDDGISGAEFANRPGFLRLMNALKPRAPFQVLVMSEESRLGREAIETAYALKQLVTGGVRVFFYLEDRERTLDSPTDKIMLSLTAFADELEREKARQRTYDAMARKARAGHVTGGRLFGYDNVTIVGANGQRSHVERRINDVEASVIREIFEMCARGDGLKTIAKDLNARAVLSPRSQQGRPRSWAPSSVREVLKRDTYRGLLTWNRTRKRDTWGQKRRRDRPSTEWLSVAANHLRIVPDALWAAAHDRIDCRRDNYRRWQRQRAAGEPDGRGVRQHYLLTGFCRCAACGGSMQAVSRASGGRRIFRYVCGTYWNRGATQCAAGRMVEMAAVDFAVKQVLATEVLRPAVVERALDLALAQLTRATGATDRRDVVRRRLADVEQKLENLADIAAKGGAVPVIVDALARHDRERQALQLELGELTRDVPDQPIDAVSLKADLRALLVDWEGLLDASVAEARALLGYVLQARIAFRHVPGDDARPAHVEVTIPIAFDRVLAAAVPILGHKMSAVREASPTGTVDNFTREYVIEVPAA